MKRFQFIAVIVILASLVCIGLPSLVIGGYSGRLPHEETVKRWAADGTRYAQISLYLSPDAGMNEYSAKQFPTAIDNALQKASIAPANAHARLCACAYSAETTVTVSQLDPETGRIKKSGVSASALAVGGDFYIFHPLKLLSGCYFNADDTILNDQILIDNNLAWQFFGSPDVVGQMLMINGRECYISGVCDVDGNYAEFYGESGRVWMSYSLLSSLNGELPITVFEVCMPNPVSGFAADIVTQSVGVNEKQYELVEHSARFTNGGLTKRLGDFAGRSVRTKLIAYPYWENTAVKLADAAAIWQFFRLLGYVLLGLTAVCEVVFFYRRIKKRFLSRKSVY